MKRFVIYSTRLLMRVSADLNRICWVLASIFIIAMLASVGLQVIARYIFFSPPSWTEELARYCMVWAGLLGATVAFHRQEDPVITAVPQPRAKWLAVMLALVRASAVIIFLLPVLYWSPVIVGHHMERLTESMKITSGYVMLVVPIFSAVILIHLLARLMGAVIKDDSNPGESD
jgi:TRAP-type C4-dicarboxylate transport system permease small subunit